MKQGHHGTGFYVLDGVPVRLGPAHRPETWDGAAVDWTEWVSRAVWISAEEYDALVTALRETPASDRDEPR